MKIGPDEIIRIPKDLLLESAIDKNDNRYGEDVYLLYNPDGYGGITSAGREAADLIRSFGDGKTVSQVFSSLKLNDNRKTEYSMCVDYLVENGFLEIVDAPKGVKPKKWKKELTCWLHITNDCNLRCRYCYIHKTHANMPKCIIIKSIDKMLESCRKHNYEQLTLMLVGGEPLMRFDTIRHIVDYCSLKCGDIKMKYVIPTNGTLITSEVAEYLVKNHISVGVSLDGIEEYNDKNRVKANGKGSYLDVMKGFDNLVAKGFKPSIMTTVTNENLDGLPKLTELMIDKKAFFRFSFERDTQTGHPAILNDEKHCIDVMFRCFDIMKKALNDGRLGWRFQFGDTTFGRPCRRACAAGRNFFAIGQDGSIGSCSLGLEAPRININDVNDIISDVEKTFADIGHTSACDVKECSQCVWRHSCAGACPLQTYATYKTCLHVSPYCKLYKACLPEVIRIYAMMIYYNNKSKEG